MVHFSIDSDGNKRLRGKKVVHVWNCPDCGTTGGKLGFSTHTLIKKVRFCSYCDESKLMETVDIEEQELASV